MKIILLYILFFSYTINAIELKTILDETWSIFKNGLSMPSRSYHTSIFTPSDAMPQSAWSNEKIIRASYVTRDKQGKFMQYSPIDHHGILIHTSNGNSYLLHNTPKTGPVVTDAKHMSKSWHKLHDINVFGDKTIGGALESAGSNILGGERCGYVEGGTCIGTAQRVEKYLKK